MESDSDTDGDRKEDFSSKQEFNKIQRNLLSSGYREGAAAGKDASFQSGFDTGYAEGFKTAFTLGKFNGILESLKRNATSLTLDPQEIDGSSFENARHGLCRVCKDGQERSDCSCKKVTEISKLIEQQKEYSAKVLDEHVAKHLPLLKKAGVDNLLSKADET